MTPHLDPNNSSQPYQCGRLFATLDYAQRVANPTVKSTLSARYLRGVMSTPGVLLGRLEGLSEIHIGKIDSKDAQQFFRDEIGAINSQLDLPLPNHLLGAEQSAFMLGYYKQIEWLKREVHATKSGVKVHRHRTTRGEWVRSALERRVLNALHKFNINYVYEVQRLLGDGIPRYPDILVNAATENRSVYIEVAGGWKDEDAYNARHEIKLREYEQSGISQAGGPNGYLRVLDFRGVDWKSKDWYDEKSMVIDALSDVIPSLTNQTRNEEH